jgi:hypothetical protein
VTSYNVQLEKQCKNTPFDADRSYLNKVSIRLRGRNFSELRGIRYIYVNVSGLKCHPEEVRKKKYKNAAHRYIAACQGHSSLSLIPNSKWKVRSFLYACSKFIEW